MRYVAPHAALNGIVRSLIGLVASLCMLIGTTGAALPVPCNGFAWWIGSWAYTVPGYDPGVTTVAAGNGGCTLHEEFVDRGGQKAHTIIEYDAKSGEWHRTVTDPFRTYRSSGRFARNGSVVFYETANDRETYTPLDRDHVGFRGEKSEDGGKTWRVLFDASYTRRAAPIAFTHVNVVPMDRERLLSDQTVIVRDGVIETMGPSSTTLTPHDAMRIDGRSKYLIPGLADMHAHLLSDDELPDSLAPDELRIMLANGVTTVRFMIGTPEQLALRGRVAAGTLDAPMIYVASPQIAGKKISAGTEFNGRVVTNADEATRAVHEFKALGYDFVKLTFFISRPVYDAVIQTAKEDGMRVLGHVDQQVGLARAIEARQQIEHLDSYLEAILADSAPMRHSVDGTSIWSHKAWESVDYFDYSKIPVVAAATAHAGIWSTPTLTFLKTAFGTGETDEGIRSRPDYRFYAPRLRAEMEATRKAFWHDPPSEARRKRFVEARNRIAKAIHDSGGKLMVGSDSPDWFLLYGFSVHRELGNLVQAGLTPYAALEAATRNPQEWLGVPTAGTIATGKRADLVLLLGNPLTDIASTQRRAGVMLRGKWFPQSSLEHELDMIAVRFQHAFDAK